MKKSGTIRTVATLLWSVLSGRATWLALAFLGIGAGVMLTGYLTSASDSFNFLLNFLTNSGMPAGEASDRLNQLRGSTLTTTLLWAVGGSFVSIGMVSIAWEVVVKKAWMTLFRQEVVGSLIDPDIFDRMKSRDHPALLQRLLETIHGEAVGDAMYRESKAISASMALMRTDFNYNITLHAHDTESDFHLAAFHLSFIVKFRARNTISFARLSDSLAFHQRYEELVQSEPDSIYRYIMLSSHDVEAAEAFKVNHCRVEDITTGASLNLVAHEAPVIAPNRYLLELRARAADRALLKSMVGKQCRIEFSISTLVDSRRKEFPIVLGYPVKNFRSRFDAKAVASEVDVLEFFTSPKHFRREDVAVLAPGSSQSSAFAAGVLDDVILPDSGLTYIWR